MNHARVAPSHASSKRAASKRRNRSPHATSKRHLMKKPATGITIPPKHKQHSVLTPNSPFSSSSTAQSTSHHTHDHQHHTCEPSAADIAAFDHIHLLNSPTTSRKSPHHHSARHISSQPHSQHKHHIVPSSTNTTTTTHHIGGVFTVPASYFSTAAPPAPSGNRYGSFTTGSLNTTTAQISPSHTPKGVYTSSHFRITQEQIGNYLQRKGITFKHTQNKTLLMECPVCPKPTYGKPDNMWKCCVFDTGAFVCLRCQSKGSWFDFKARLGDVPNITNAMGTPIYQQHEQIQQQSLDPDDPMNEYQAHEATFSTLSQTDAQSWTKQLPDFPDILHYFENTRKIKLDTLKKFKVGAKKQQFPELNTQTKQIEWIDQDCMTFPWTDRKSLTDSDDVEYSRVKVRSLSAKKNMRLLPKGGSWGFFGWHLVPLDAKSIIITEGELDAMSVYQTTGLPAISLPNGANSLPPALLPCLERFEKIILWLDDDQAGVGALEGMISKLGVQRTFHIPGGYGAKDANEALQKNLNIAAILDTATRQQHKQIYTFSSFRHEVKRMFLDPNSHVGVAYPNMPILQSLMKGHRRGELTILTGGTGVGKTTVLTQLSLELAMQGVNTLWGSFEIRNPRLARTLLKQYAPILGITLNESAPESFDYVADKFEQLPFHFLKFYGSSPVQEILEAMEYSTYVHDAQHIILDNLQFMLSGQGRGTGDKFDIQDKAIEAFRQFASQHNVHVTIVIHPRKEQDNSSLGLASVFGSAKATQEADNVLIIQSGLPKTILRNIQIPAESGTKSTAIRIANTEKDLSQNGGFDDPIIGEIMSTFFRTIELRKNRWDGDLGNVPLRFDKKSNRFYELSKKDIDMGLGHYIMEQKKLKQMDLIKNINQFEGNEGLLGGGGNGGAGNNTPSGFQNMKQQQFTTSGGGSNNNYKKFQPSSHASNQTRLTPHQEFELNQQLEREQASLMNAMLNGGEESSDGENNSPFGSGGASAASAAALAASAVTSTPNISSTNTHEANVSAYGSPQALATRNMENKMLQDMESTMLETGQSSGNLNAHPDFFKLQSQKRSLGQMNDQQITNNNNNPQTAQFTKYKKPQTYVPTMDIIME